MLFPQVFVDCVLVVFSYYFQLFKNSKTFILLNKFCVDIF